jgi:outer membrane protein TolC
LSAVRQIADALSALQYTQTQLDESNDTLTIRRDAMQIAQNAYATGIDGKFPYLESLIEMDHTKLHDMEENLAWLNDITDAATALGGGFGGAQS